MRKNNVNSKAKKIVMIAAAGALTAGLSFAAMAAPQGGGFGGGAPAGQGMESFSGMDQNGAGSGAESFGGTNGIGNGMGMNAAMPEFQGMTGDERPELPEMTDGTRPELPEITDGTLPEAKSMKPDKAPAVNEDGSAAGEITEDERPELPAGERPELPEMTDGTRPELPAGMPAGQGMRPGEGPKMNGGIEAMIEGIEDEDVKEELESLAASLKEALDAEKEALDGGDADEDTLTELKEAVKKAADALKEAFEDARSAAEAED